MTQISPAELSAKLALWRERARAGTLSPEDCREAVALLRAGRVSAAYSSETARKAKAKAVIPSADDLLAEMDDL